MSESEPWTDLNPIVSTDVYCTVREGKGAIFDDYATDHQATPERAGQARIANVALNLATNSSFNSIGG